MNLADYGYHVKALWFIAPKYFYIIWLSNLSTLSVPDEYYSKKHIMRNKFDIYVFI